MASVHNALADVANRLQSLKAALSEKQLGADGEASQLLAMASELEALLRPQAPAPAPAAAQAMDQKSQQPAAAQQPEQAYGAPSKAAGLPATPFNRRRVPAAGPATAAKAPAPTPGGGLPATTPLAAEVLASLNAAGSGTAAETTAAGAAAAAAVPHPLAADQTGADGDAAATLKGLFGGLLELRLSGAASTCVLPPPQQPAAQQQQQQFPDLASLLQDGGLAPPPPAMHTAALAAAAAAAAGPALPVPRRQSAAPLGMLPSAILGQQREQRPCNCKRSMCLKMYCECFAAGGFCAPSCSCLNCSNTPADFAAVQAAREVVLAKNPKAFEVKVTAAEGHKRGCRCKRSKCLKKYCECFHAGARCNPDICQCEDCRNTEGDAMLAPVLAKQQAPVALQQQQSWAEASADVLAMFQQPLALTAADGGAEPTGSSGRRGSARAQQLPLPPPMPVPSLAGFPSFAGLPPMPEPAAPSSLPAFHPATAAAAAMLGALPPSSLFAPPPPPLPVAFDPAAAAAFMLNPVAAAAAASLAAAATLAEQQQQMEESMADAVSCPAPVAPTTGISAQAAGPALPPGNSTAAAAALAATPKVASALTSHLSDMAGPADSEMHDTATSPAPHMALTKLAARRSNLIAAVAPTLTGGILGPLGRPPLPSSRVRSRANSPEAQLSQGSADENGGDSYNTAGSQRSKRPRRAASGGVLGAVAAEASEWGLEMVSPPLKRTHSLPAGMEQGISKASGRGKVSDRVALLKKALVGETAAAAAHKAAALLAQAEAQCAPTAEDEDAISALFELSSSVC